MFFAVGLFLVTFSLASNVVLPIGTIMAERLLYLPSVGFCMLLGLVCDRLFVLDRRGARTVAMVGIVAVTVGYAARTVMRNRDWRNEFALFSSAARVSPNSAKVHYNLGTLYKDRGLFHQAVAEYERALEIEPGLLVIRYNLGNVYRELGRLDEAIAAYRRILQVRPNMVEVLYNLGMAYKDKGLLDKAADAYRQALAVRPDYADAHNNLGNVYKRMGSLDRAVTEYLEALKIQPDLAEAHYNLGVAYERMGRMEEAVGAYERFVRYARNRPQVEMVRERIRRLREAR